MLKNGVNSVLITEYHRPIGVINDRELLKEIVVGQKDPKQTLAKDLKYTPLLVLDEGESIIDAMKIMQEKGMNRIAMVKNGQLVGMLTEELAKKQIPLSVKQPVS